MDTIRAFIALELDPAVKDNISYLISQLKEAGPSIKWVDAEGLHFTLKFLGDIDRSLVQPISNELEKISKEIHPFKISFSKIGAFPDMDKPKVFWLGVKDNSQVMANLAKEIESRLENLGLEKESRLYKPHLTLGRARSLRNISTLIKRSGEIEVPIDNANIQEIVLYQSTLTAKGAIYKKLISFKFNI